MTIRTQRKADISMRQQLRTSAHEDDRLKLLVVRAGLKAGAYRRGARIARARSRD